MSRSFYNIRLKSIGQIAALAIPLLSACGGGSGDSGNSVGTPVPPPAPAPSVLSLLAGNTGGYGSQDGASSVARLGIDMGPIAVTAAGDVVMADGNRIRMLHAGSQQVSTLAGGGLSDKDLTNAMFLAADPFSRAFTNYADGAGTAARFRQIGAVAVDAAGNTYVADTNNYLVRKIDAAGMVTTLAGQAGVCGNQDGVGTAATLCEPSSIAVDKAGNVYVAEVKRNTGDGSGAANPIRKITAAGVVSTLTPKASEYPGGGSIFTGSVYKPVRLALDSSGTLYAADPNDHVIRKFTADGHATVLSGTVASQNRSGDTDGAASAAKFGELRAIAVDRADRLFVLDQFVDSFGHGLPTTIRQIGNDGSATTLLRAQSCTAGLQATSTNLPGTLCNARQMAISADGNFLVVEADTLSDYEGLGRSYTQLRSYTPQGASTVLAGVAPVFGLTDGQGSAARFYGPAALAMSKSGILFVHDRYNKAVRTVATDGTVRTLGKICDYSDPYVLCGVTGALGVDGEDNLYLSTGTAISKITPAGTVTQMAKLENSPAILSGGMTVDSTGNVYASAATYTGAAIFKVSPKGEIALFAGSLDSRGRADGQGNGARFSQIGNMTVDAAGNLYVVDVGNDSRTHAMFGPTIRKITPAGMVSTLAGNPNAAPGLADGAGAAAVFTVGYFGAPDSALAVDAQGNVYVTDSLNSVIRRITPNGQVSTLIGQAWQYGFAAGALPGIINRPKGIAVQGSTLYISMDNAVVQVKPN